MSFSDRSPGLEAYARRRVAVVGVKGRRDVLDLSRTCRVRFMVDRHVITTGTYPDIILRKYRRISRR